MRGTVSARVKTGLGAIAVIAGCVWGPPSGDCALTVILARHAEPVSSADPDPPLSAAGKRRAQSLAATLRATGVAAIYTTEFRRAEQTAQPLADSLHVAVQRVGAERTTDLVEAILKRQSGVVVAIGHSDTVPRVVAALGGPAIDIAPGEFDALFVVSIAGSDVSVVRLRYGAGAPPVAASTSSKRSQVMKINFVRSGGFAAMPGLTVQGVIDLDESAGKVTSESRKYQRDLPAREVEQLRLAADPARMARAKAALAALSSKLSDAYQYDISVVTSDGKSQKLTFNAGGGDDVDKAAPGLGGLVRWIDDEAQKIKEHR